jgi:hypothetical protein
MQPENLAYALAQVVHNFGAVAVVGGAAFALWAGASSSQREAGLARLVGLGWAVQLASGTGLGAVSYYYYGRLPELHPVALAALDIKIGCAVAGLAVALRFHYRAESWNEGRRKLAWQALTALGAAALAAAAFLRWFS